MTPLNLTYLNVGIYTVAEASRLTGVSKDRIRRWLRGYRSSRFWEQAQKFVKCFPEIIAAAQRAKRGSSFIVTVNGKFEG